MKGDSDSEIIALVLSGDVDSFGELFRRHRDTCTRFAVRMLGSRADADDVLQLAFMRAFRGLRSCNDRARFGGWLYRIVVNECRTYLSRERRRELRFVADGDAINLAIAQGTEDDADEEWSDAVARALGLLPLEQREAFLLRYVEEMNYEEMVEITGVGLSALKMRVKRACEALRVSLEEVNHG